MLIYEYLSNIFNFICPEKLAEFYFPFPLLWDNAVSYIFDPLFKYNIHIEKGINPKSTAGWIFSNWTHLCNQYPSQEIKTLSRSTGLLCSSFQSLTTRVRA